MPDEGAEAHWGRRPLATPLGRYRGYEVRTIAGSDWSGYFVVEVEVDTGEVGVGISVRNALFATLLSRFVGPRLDRLIRLFPQPAAEIVVDLITTIVQLTIGKVVIRLCPWTALQLLYCALGEFLRIAFDDSYQSI